jgi:hypothetical protein
MVDPPHKLLLHGLHRMERFRPSDPARSSDPVAVRYGAREMKAATPLCWGYFYSAQLENGEGQVGETAARQSTRCRDLGRLLRGVR